MSMKDKLHTGELYLPDDEEIMNEQSACMELLYDFNATRPSETEKRTELLKKMFAEIGEVCGERSASCNPCRKAWLNPQKSVWVIVPEKSANADREKDPAVAGTTA